MKVSKKELLLFTGSLITLAGCGQASKEDVAKGMADAVATSDARNAAQMQLLLNKLSTATPSPTGTPDVFGTSVSRAVKTAVSENLPKSCQTCADKLATGEAEAIQTNVTSVTSTPTVTGTPTAESVEVTPRPTSGKAEPTKASTPTKPASEQGRLTCADVGNEDPKLPLVRTFGFPSGVGGTNLFTVGEINRKFDVSNINNGKGYENAGWGVNMFADPGVTVAQNIDVSPEMAPNGVYEVTIPNGTFLGAAGQEFLATDMDSGRQVGFIERQGAMQLGTFRANVDGEPLRIRFECFVPGHFQLKRYEAGTFVSQDEMKDIMAAGHSAEDSLGKPTGNCGGGGCLRVTTTGVEFGNNKTFDSWTQFGINGPMERVTSNIVP